MNKLALKLALVVIVAMVIYPPYEMLGLMGKDVVIEFGYAWIYDFPSCYRRPDNCGFDTRIDIVRLFIQVVLVSVVALLASYAFSSSRG